MSAPIGAGHVRAAEAIGQAACKLNPAANVKYIDIFTLFPGSLGKLFLSCYYKSLLVFPQLYANAYAWGNESKMALISRRVLSGFLASRVKPDILAFAPDVVVCTHATSAGMMDYLIREVHIPLCAVSVVTDFVIHRLWMYPATAGYFIADESLKRTWIEQFVPQEKLHAMGIPVTEPFGQPYDRRACRKELQVRQNARMILIMGGGAGLLPMSQIAEALNELPIPLQLFMVTGNNEQNYRTLCGLKLNPQHEMRVLRFVKEVHVLMAAADVLISKPGGITASEALCMRLPLLIYRPLPGQEQANADFLTEKNTAIQIQNLEILKKEINKIFRIDTNVAENMKTHARRIARPKAAEEIAGYLLKNYCK